VGRRLLIVTAADAGATSTRVLVLGLVIVIVIVIGPVIGAALVDGNDAVSVADPP
jgi:hypothetical protein